jgi:hypothetical protein
MVQKCTSQQPLEPTCHMGAVDWLYKQQQQYNFKETSEADQEQF